MFLLRNFEESEDELREEVADSMRNLFVMETDSSEEESAEAADGREDKQNGETVVTSDPQQIQTEVKESCEHIAARLLKPEPEHDNQLECPGESQTER